jgi:uncharacterized protein
MFHILPPGVGYVNRHSVNDKIFFMQNIWLAFLTGLTTGGISCLAVQGGLLASGVADTTEKKMFGKTTKVGSFLLAKLVAYTILGFALGSLGSKLVLTPGFLGAMQIAAGVFMLMTAGRLLDIHPIFRHFVIQPPKFVLRRLRTESKVDSVFTPAILGFLTVLIPCGVTQAMMAVSIASGSAVIGAGIMFAFVLGTSPVFFAMGMAASELFKKKAFAYAASLVIVFLGLMSINTGQALRGSVHTAQNYALAAKSIFKSVPVLAGQVAGIKNGVQEVTINAYSNGYTSETNTLKANVPVRLTVISNDVTSCARSFIIPSLGISQILPQDGAQVIEFTPTKDGLLSFSCGMGMYTGQFTVVN